MHPDADPPTPPTVRAPSDGTPDAERIRRRRTAGWRWAAAAGAALTLGVLGLVAMSVLAGRAEARVRAACVRFDGDNSAVHWQHGFPLAVPVGTVAVFGAALVLAVVALAGRGRPLGVRALGIVLTAPALVGLLVAGTVLADFLAYPGTGAASSMPPCGGG
ncbi:hypothetical protein Athai_33910 [Actinocatenispora thailandica]|uniref:Uncharacterized protein n=1 Tax=Actinocatenispora thailandica TaxID=227318 RepID=A0A7R7HYB5_9ACTN|nr:hypothetical protein [Actinocatenispora thailandica]BCJ35888.1 hypothetical protein Athai_33910 [Actinocatenispora thailandica]